MGEVYELRKHQPDLNSERDDDSPFLSFKLSWVAYVRLIWDLLFRTFLLVVVAIVLGMVFADAKLGEADVFVTVALFLAVAWVVYDFLWLRSVVLYTDEDGVWLYRGVLPWSRGVSGVKWRDINEATFGMGFLGWVLRSYSVRVSHRFTQDAELAVRNVRFGNLAVEHINSILFRIGGAR